MSEMRQSLKSVSMQRDHSLIHSLHSQGLSMRSAAKQEYSQLQNDYNYPLQGSKMFNQLGLNPIPIKLQKRTSRDFESPKKLEIAKPDLSLTKYELYQRKNVALTKKRFENDPDRQKAVKLPAQMSRDNINSLLRLNPEMKEFLEWR